MDHITVSNAVDGWELHAAARRLSQNTLNDYRNTFRKFQAFLSEDLLLADVSVEHIQRFMATQNGLSKKTLLNYHTGLSALWRWASDENLVQNNIIREVRPPKPEKRAVNPYERDEIKAMLRAAEFSKKWERRGQRATSSRLATATRNKALVLILLDTGIRASELSEATMDDLDRRLRRLKVFGKGAKERILPISPGAGKMLWRYLASRPKNDKAAGRPVFVGRNGKGFDRVALLQIIRRIGDRAGVPKANLHRFRHTFAIEFLRNGGNPWALQALLGHESLDMVRRYLALVQSDVERAHRLASPVANWSDIAI